MATIGSLSIMLKANASAFMGAMKKAGGAVKGLAGGVMSLASPLNLIKAAIGGLAIGGLVSMASKAVRAAAEMARTARLANTSAAGFATLQHAVRAVGGDAEAVTRGLQRLNETLSGIGTDARYAADVFERFGLSFDRLAAGDGYEATRKIADAVASAVDPLQKASIAAAAFGNDAGAWLSVLNQGAAGIDKMAEQARKLGLTFDQIDATNIEKASGQLNEMDDAITGISRQSAVQLASVFTDTADSVKSIALEFGDLSKIVKATFRGIALAGAKAWDVIQIGFNAFFGAMTVGFTKLFEWIVRGLKKIFDVAGKLPDKLGGNMFRNVAGSLDQFASSVEATAERMRGTIVDSIDNTHLEKDVDAFFASLDHPLQRAAKTIEFTKKLAANGGVQAFSRYGKAISGFANIFKENQSPLESFQDKLKELNLFLQSTGNLDSYSRGVAKLVGELEKAHGLHEIKLARGLQAGSTEAASAINQAEALNNRRLKEKPEDRVRRILEESREIEKQQLEYQRRIADALRPPQVARIPA